jgi:hypothetical protein
LDLRECRGYEERTFAAEGADGGVDCDSGEAGAVEERQQRQRSTAPTGGSGRLTRGSLTDPVSRRGGGVKRGSSGVQKAQAIVVLS